MKQHGVKRKPENHTRSMTFVIFTMVCGYLQTTWLKQFLKELNVHVFTNDI